MWTASSRYDYFGSVNKDAPEIATVDFVSIRKVLASGTFLVPDFQRPFAWSTEHVQEFWDDIVDPTRKAPYFIGPVVIFQLDAAGPVYGVVDGQQRLTTLVLLLSVLREKAVELGMQKIASDIAGLLLDGGTTPRLDSHSSGEVLRAAQQGESEQNLQLRLRGRKHKRIREARVELRARVDAEFAPLTTARARRARFDRLTKAILELRVIRSELADPLRAFTFFETLNSRGADLETVDLLKNLLFERRTQGGGSSDSIRDAWDAFVGQLTRRNIASKTMLYHWWLSRRGYVTKRAMYSAIRAEHITIGPVQALDVVNEMEVAARAYSVIARPRAGDWSNQLQDVRHLLDLIGKYGVAQPRPFLLALVMAKRGEGSGRTSEIVSAKRVRQALSAIEAFHLVYNAISKKTSLPEISRAYADRAVELSESSDRLPANGAVLGLVGDLRGSGHLPTREVFVATIVDSPRYVSRAGANRVILRVLELWNAANGVSMAGREQLTIEHWQPRSESDPWANTVGNLALLPAPTNNVDFADKSPLEKWQLLQDGSVDTGGLYVSDLTPEWNRAAVEERARLIGHAIYDYLERSLKVS